MPAAHTSSAHAQSVQRAQRACCRGRHAACIPPERRRLSRYLRQRMASLTSGCKLNTVRMGSSFRPNRSRDCTGTDSAQHAQGRRQVTVILSAQAASVRCAQEAGGVKERYQHPPVCKIRTAEQTRKQRTK